MSYGWFATVRVSYLSSSSPLSSGSVTSTSRGPQCRAQPPWTCRRFDQRRILVITTHGRIGETRGRDIRHSKTDISIGRNWGRGRLEEVRGDHADQVFLRGAGVNNSIFGPPIRACNRAVSPDFHPTYCIRLITGVPGSTAPRGRSSVCATKREGCPSLKAAWAAS
jgi:hypothetical protein